MLSLENFFAIIVKTSHGSLSTRYFLMTLPKSRLNSDFSSQIFFFKIFFDTQLYTDWRERLREMTKYVCAYVYFSLFSIQVKFRSHFHPEISRIQSFANVEKNIFGLPEGD